MIPASFVNHTCDILAETNTGLSGAKIVKYLTPYAFKYGADIPYAEYPFPSSVPNKRTALRENLHAFAPDQQIQIINELCQLDEIKDNQSVKNLRYQLISRYGHLLNNLKGDSIDLELIEQTKHWLAD